MFIQMVAVRFIIAYEEGSKDFYMIAVQWMLMLCKVARVIS